MLAASVVESYGGRVRFASENYGDSALAKRYGVTRYPAIFVEDVSITSIAATRDRYGRNQLGQSVLLGRRLIEAGVRLVHVNCMSSLLDPMATWDSHKDNFNILKNQRLPPADAAQMSNSSL